MLKLHYLQHNCARFNKKILARITQFSFSDWYQTHVSCKRQDLFSLMINQL